MQQHATLEPILLNKTLQLVCVCYSRPNDSSQAFLLRPVGATGVINSLILHTFHNFQVHSVSQQIIIVLYVQSFGILEFKLQHYPDATLDKSTVLAK